ncbi:MAG: two-component system chemotaxis response regulator CheY [Gammaproteobacteria bacterium]|jgi:two-component system chemotaxis response regulator CheY
MARILAVDDSPSMRRMVNFALKNGGFDVLEAEDGVQAFEVAQRESVDLVLTDINMPRMDGFELIAKLRTLSNYKFVPILTLTTESSAEKKAKAKAAGATGWIVKPFDTEQLISVINRLVC